MTILENKPIKESEMTSDRKDNVQYAAQLLCEAFYGAAQNPETIYAGKDIDDVVKVFSSTLIAFIQREPMCIDRRIKMDPKEKNIRVKHFISELINAIK